jgi:hypothetical protein
VDTDQLSELAEDRAKLWDQSRGGGFPQRGEKREQLGFGRTGGHDGDDGADALLASLMAQAEGRGWT